MRAHTHTLVTQSHIMNLNTVQHPQDSRKSCDPLKLPEGLLYGG